ncbi:SRPBCC domain-containing protein [Pantoea sp. LMR881]|uniref:SRPBCC family protein n=1 Tax=Pantoea sp. LMR881 TaxID=3014336 RepID=UPI0022B0334D|nr:SRPBCC domain-containing protein [Pantoea sp. LMR881]MCZ4057893.1 SRPBCC domain-containing protein [Pantoea sp. LMR881]
MITLHHAIKIAAPRSMVFLALADVITMSKWHVGEVEGEIALGKILTLHPKPGTHFSWRTEVLEPDSKIEQTSVQETDSHAGKRLTFILSDLDDGQTLVKLSHGEWSEQDPHLPFCNTWWGEVLHQLKLYAEKA